MSKSKYIKYVLFVVINMWFLLTNFQYVISSLEVSKNGFENSKLKIKRLNVYSGDNSNNNNTSQHTEDIPDASMNLIHEGIKYILQWTSGNEEPISFMGKGRVAFVLNNCEFTNCYVTDDRNFFPDLTDFDAIVFHGKRMHQSDLPRSKDANQKYIFAMMESAHYYPVCDSIYDNYFNWTWTYRLDSDFRFGYITIYDLNGTVVGPKVDVTWPTNLDPIGEEIKAKLASKTKPAAWFASNCKTPGKREDFVRQLNQESSKYGWSADVYGRCGTLHCQRFKTTCDDMLVNDYYFYFSFENSFAQDYVTEKLLTALNNYAVPVVYGGANYSRFLPPGSYLNARELGVQRLAATMDEIMKNRTRYEDYHRWRNHYTYEETSDNEDICSLCTIMNNEQKYKTKTVYNNFRDWWNIDTNSCSWLKSWLN